MPSQLHQDPTATMAPSQRQELQNAQSNPIGSAKDAGATLAQLDRAHDRLVAQMRAANKVHTDTTSLPESVSEDAPEWYMRLPSRRSPRLKRPRAAIWRDYQQRTGDVDPFGYLTGMR